MSSLDQLGFSFKPPERRVWSVRDLVAAVRTHLEREYGDTWVQGEISNFRGVHSSGHAYFCLKDDSARIDAVVWKGTFSKLKTKPQEGLEVIATGKITTFPGKSSYQIVIEAIEPAGIGALSSRRNDSSTAFFSH